MTKVRVVAAVVDTRQLTLYKENGETVLIPQGDPRLRKILDEVTPVCSQGGVATVDISEVNVYRDFEEQSGIARFFRVAKNKVASFFGAAKHEEGDAVAPTSVGKLPALSSAIDDIIAHATPAANDDSALKTNETMVAVVGSGKNAKIIPGMENLKDQFTHALKLGSTKGVENFLRRLSAVIDERQHSIHDLLKFMERGDLPIADDGSIIIYKVLRRSKNGQPNVFVDCHSNKVTQRVGSFVCMDPKMVDPNRRKDCSYGLHVARRGYLGQFHGDVCVLAKVAPEDVIAVPEYDANKMRVCGYHILFELDDDSFRKLKANKPMTDNPKAQALLGRAISGNHPARLEEVRITKQLGGGVVVTPLNEKGQPIAKSPVRKVTAIDDVQSAPSIDPRQVAKEVTETKRREAQLNATGSVIIPTRQQTARSLFDNGDIQQLIAFKKKAKVSWASLGLSEEEQQHILKMMTAEASGKPVPKPAPKPATKQAPTVKAPAKKAAPAKKPKVGRPVHGQSTKARLFELEKIYLNQAADPAHRADAALELITLRGKTKKSWNALGYPKLTDRLLLDDVQTFQQQAQQAPKAQVSQKEQARLLYNTKKWPELAAFKKSKKKSWEALGFTSKQVAEIKLHTGG